MTKAPTSYAVCSADSEPLVWTFEFHGMEWICQVCGRKYTMFGPDAKDATPELAARHTELDAEYRSERAAREGASAE